MKAMIFAAGRGERMGKLTRATPKPLLEVAGKPLIDHAVRRLQQAGFRQLVVNLAYLGEQIEDYLGSGENFGVEVVYSREAYPLETGGGIAHALPILGDEPFLIINADVWTDYPFQHLRDYQLGPDQLGHLVMVPNPSHVSEGDFYLDESSCLQAEPGTAAQDRFTYSGIAVLDPALVAGYSGRREKFPLVETFREAMQGRRLSGEVYRGEWRDIGTPERLAALQALVQSVP